jgi:2,3-bisphosphoglycerate-dependent phosphoglycerate mutase
VPKGDLPGGESLEQTVRRFLPYWEQAIAPRIRAGRRCFVVAHGNSLRALVKHLDGLSDDEIVGLNIPTGIPLVYDLGDDLRPRGHKYLGDPEEARRAAERVAAQGKTKP